MFGKKDADDTRDLTLDTGGVDVVENLPSAYEYLDLAFGEGGWLSKSLPGYLPREGQRALSDRIAKTLFDRAVLTAEGPTGTGKSFAYLIPAIYHSCATGERVVVVTANISLQEQLVEKDLPLLKKTLPWEFSYCKLKGIGNYLCLDKLAKRTEGKVRLPQYKDQRDHDADREVLRWSKNTSTGDKSEIKFSPSEYVWSQFSAQSEECKGHECKYADECYGRDARKKTAGVNVIVTNYHMLYANLQFPTVLPTYKVAILDEAHEAAEIARNFFGFKITEYSLRYTARKIISAPGQPSLKDEIRDRAADLFTDLRDLQKSGRYDVRFHKSPPVRWEEVYKTLNNIAASYRGNMSRTRDKDHAADLRKAAEAAEKVAVNLHAAMTVEDSNFVYYLEGSWGGNLSICSKKIDISEDMKLSFFVPDRSVVLTSATLAVGGGFDYVAKELGIEDGYRGLVASSPFDWVKQASLIIPKDFPDPTAKHFKQAVGYALGDIVKMAKGRTLALFTSKEGMEVAHKHLLSLKLPYRILKQYEKPNQQLIEEFTNDVHSVLLGVASFWQGIDVPGEALSCVVIDKLPFPRRDDPVLDALQDRCNVFTEHFVPRAAVALKQGFGRLIRTSTDKGVIVLLDNRIHTKWDTYGKKIVFSLPEVPRYTDLDEVQKALA